MRGYWNWMRCCETARLIFIVNRVRGTETRLERRPDRCIPHLISSHYYSHLTSHLICSVLTDQEHQTICEAFSIFRVYVLHLYLDLER